MAVRHTPAGEGYRPLSEAMVNIRRTLQAAQDEGIVSAAMHCALVAAAATLFYQDRTWPELLQAGAAYADAAEVEAVRRWLPTGRIDQQADDAVAMLREMRGFLAADPEPPQASWRMADTAMWEVAKGRADTRPQDDAVGSAHSPELLERVLDELRLLDQDAFDAACCRSLLRVFAAGFAVREGVTIDEDRRHAAIAGFRASRNLGHDAELTRFLADNELSPGDFDRLIATDELVRWACEHAGPEAYGALLDDLRLSGEYAGLVSRARAKADDGRQAP